MLEGLTPGEARDAVAEGVEQQIYAPNKAPEHVGVCGWHDYSKGPLPVDNPLSEKAQEVKVEMRMPNISIPRLMSFLVEVEKSNKYLKVQDLQIRGRYGTKLYFDGQAKVRGYDVGSH